jgi:TIR domain
MAHDVFISYSSRDKTTADATCAVLEAAGIRCWIAPRDITPGAEWGEAIIDAIAQARAFVLIFSANANDSAQIRREVERAVHKGIPVIPLRIEDIAPTRSLEYFIGTVHWLDALTPPIEAHLRRLVDSLKALLQIHPASPANAGPEIIRPKPTQKTWRMPAGIALACLAAILAATALWAIFIPKPQPTPASTPNQSMPSQSTSSQSLPNQPAAQPSRASVDPAVVGTLVLDSVIDDYDWHFIYSIAAAGSYRLITTQTEDGTYRAGNGGYRTVGGKTGRARTGSYRAVGNAIEVKPAAGAAVIFRAAAADTTVDQAHPVMLGVWRSTIQLAGLAWTLTIQNNPDGSFHYQGQTEDSGTCMFADGRWWTKSAVTGQLNAGTYRLVDVRTVEITGANGAALWQRQ